jgi:hypothetical protein
VYRGGENDGGTPLHDVQDFHHVLPLARGISGHGRCIFLHRFARHSAGRVAPSAAEADELIARGTHDVAAPSGIVRVERGKGTACSCPSASRAREYRIALGPGTRCRCSGGLARMARMRSSTSGANWGEGVLRPRGKPNSTLMSCSGASPRRVTHFLTQPSDRPPQAAHSLWVHAGWVSSKCCSCARSATQCSVCRGDAPFQILSSSGQCSIFLLMFACLLVHD